MSAVGQNGCKWMLSKFPRILRSLPQSVAVCVANLDLLQSLWYWLRVLKYHRLVTAQRTAREESCHSLLVLPQWWGWYVVHVCRIYYSKIQGRGGKAVNITYVGICLLNDEGMIILYVFWHFPDLFIHF